MSYCRLDQINNQSYIYSASDAAASFCFESSFIR